LNILSYKSGNKITISKKIENLSKIYSRKNNEFYIRIFLSIKPVEKKIKMDLFPSRFIKHYCIFKILKYLG